MKNQSKIHHYVPKHLVGNFSGNSKGQVCVFDKKTSKHFWTNPKNICAENKYNEFLFEGFIVSYEAGLSKLESYYLPALKKVVHDGDISSLNKAEIQQLHTFIAFQFVRTKFYRNQFRKLATAINKRVAEISPNEALKNSVDLENEDKNKAVFLKDILKQTSTLASILAERDMFLIESGDHLDNFILGDHPVVMHNDKTFGPYGNIGWAVPGIQIFAPISPSLTIACWCPSILNEVQKPKDKLKGAVIGRVLNERCTLKEVLSSAGLSEDEYYKQVHSIENFYNAVKVTKKLKATSENVVFQNALQVQYSTRYLMSDRENFSLAERMIADDEKHRCSLGIQVN